MITCNKCGYTLSEEEYQMNKTIIRHERLREIEMEIDCPKCNHKNKINSQF